MEGFFTENVNWTGNAKELALKANEWFLNSKTGQSKELTERLVRDYVARRILDRPERKGKEAFFSFRQLIQLLAARHLVDANWPLDDIEREFRGQTTEMISRFIPGVPLDADAGDTYDLIDQFRQEAGYGRDDAKQQLLKRKVDQARQQVDISSALRNIGSDLTNVIKEDFTAFQLATWMILFVDQNRAASLTIQQAEQIGRSITAALLNPRSLNTRDYQYAANSAADEMMQLHRELQWEKEQRNLTEENFHRKTVQLEEELLREKEQRNLIEGNFVKEKKFLSHEISALRAEVANLQKALKEKE